MIKTYRQLFWVNLKLTSIILFLILLSCKNEVKSHHKVLEQSNNDSLIFQKKWTDKSGENIFEARRYTNYNALEGQNIFKLNVVLKNSLGIVIIKDSIFDCPVDTDLNFISKSFELSDFDSNGFKEVSFLYNKYCRGDISGDDLLLFCIEKNKKWSAIGYRTNDALKTSSYYTGLGNLEKENIPEKFKGKMQKKWYQFSNEDKVYTEIEIDSLYGTIDDWKGTYTFSLSDLEHMGETHSIEYFFIINESCKVISKVDHEQNTESNCDIVSITKDVLFLKNNSDEYKIYKDEQGNFNVSGQTIYMINPPNESYILTRE